MSAWILSPEHIDLIITEAVKHDEIPAEYSKSGWGQVLINENYKSVNYRYTDHEMAGHYEHVPFPLAYTRHDVDVALRCYRYQTCEHPEWDRSPVNDWIERMIVANKERFEPQDVEHAVDDDIRAWPVEPGREWSESLFVPSAHELDA